jgi:ABC-type phosphate/phosphonate transport system substrate-binding protein
MTLVPGGHIFPKIYIDRNGTSGKFNISVNYASGNWPTSVDVVCGKFDASVNETGSHQRQQNQIAYTFY